jgi:CRISPR-associated endoribonuclease Cas6
MPNAFVLTLISSQNQPIHLTNNNGKHAHGLLFQLLAAINPDLATAIHAAQRKPFTLALLPQPKHSQNLLLRLTTLDDDLFAPLLQRIISENLVGLRLGDQHFYLTQVLATPEGHPLAAASSWQQLAQSATVGHCWLRCHSPTVFATAKAEGRSRHTPLPEPLLIAKSLLANWQYHSPLRYTPELATSLREAFELELELVEFNHLRFGRSHIGHDFIGGFIGDIHLHCHAKSAVVQQAFATLMHYSFFAGLGAKTTFGLGLTTPLA